MGDCLGGRTHQSDFRDIFIVVRHETAKVPDRNSSSLNAISIKAVKLPGRFLSVSERGESG